MPAGDRHAIAPGLSITSATNDGAALGLLSGSGRIVGVAGAVILPALALLAWRRITARPAAAYGAIMLAAGALGNVSERLVRSSVTDYLDPLRWPPFNVADMLVIAGGALLLSAVAPSETDARASEGG